MRVPVRFSFAAIAVALLASSAQAGWPSFHKCNCVPVTGPMGGFAGYTKWYRPCYDPLDPGFPIARPPVVETLPAPETVKPEGETTPPKEPGKEKPSDLEPPPPTPKKPASPEPKLPKLSRSRIGLRR